jgi:hypothetical protein
MEQQERRMDALDYPPPSASILRSSGWWEVRMFSPMTFVVFVILTVLEVLAMMGVAYVIARRWLM